MKFDIKKIIYLSVALLTMGGIFWYFYFAPKTSPYFWKAENIEIVNIETEDGSISRPALRQEFVLYDKSTDKPAQFAQGTKIYFSDSDTGQDVGLDALDAESDAKEQQIKQSVLIYPTYPTEIRNIKLEMPDGKKINIDFKWLGTNVVEIIPALQERVYNDTDEIGFTLKNIDLNLADSIYIAHPTGLIIPQNMNEEHDVAWLPKYYSGTYGIFVNIGSSWYQASIEL